MEPAGSQRASRSVVALKGGSKEKRQIFRVRAQSSLGKRLHCTDVRGLADHVEGAYMAAPKTRASHKKLQPKPKTESKSWQTRNAARKDKQTAHAANLAAKTEQ